MTDITGVKPHITTDTVLSVLWDYFGQPITDLAIVDMGRVAQTFSFNIGTQEYIIRFNAPMGINFEKDAYAYQHFASSRIPIPRVLHVGRWNDLYFAIAEKAPGQTLLQIPWADYLALLPTQIETLDAIHAIDVANRTGYGVFDGRGIASGLSWAGELTNIEAEERPGDFFGQWHTLFRDSFLEQDLFYRIYDRMLHLLVYCPEERFLVHSNYGFNNVLVQDGRITAILDWIDAKYGDFLYDVAWLDFWAPGVKFQELFWQHYTHTHRDVPFYAERVLCYQCSIALDALKFNTKAQDKPGYDWVRDRIRSLLPNLEA